jgi:hypothetical protein
MSKGGRKGARAKPQQKVSWQVAQGLVLGAPKGQFSPEHMKGAPKPGAAVKGAGT